MNFGTRRKPTAGISGKAIEHSGAKRCPLESYMEMIVSILMIFSHFCQGICSDINHLKDYYEELGRSCSSEKVYLELEETRWGDNGMYVGV